MTTKTSKTPAQPATQPDAQPAPDAAPASPTLPVDQWHGVGGEYVIEDGVRRRVGGPALPGEAELSS